MTEYGKADAEYQIVVDMAEKLVPDVCALIMGFLETIHIEKGRQKWRELMKRLCTEYSKLFIFKEWCDCLMHTRSGFLFNYRNLEESRNKLGRQTDICHINMKTLERSIVQSTSPNYYYSAEWDVKN